MSIASQYARYALRCELAKEANAQALKGRNLRGVPSSFSKIFDPEQLPEDVTQLVPDHGDFRSAPPEWPEMKLCIIGAGVSGLYIAMMLDFLAIPNLTYEIVESSDRAGGRLYTHHFNEDAHQYYDIGAMRYPRIPAMDRTFDLFERLGLTRAGKEIKFYKSYIDGVRNTPEYYNSILNIANLQEATPTSKDITTGEPDTFRVSRANGGTVPDASVAVGWADILDDEYAPFRQALDDDFKKGWLKLMGQDKYSIREYLRNNSPHGDFDTIQWIETMNVGSNMFDQGFSDGLLDDYAFTVPDVVPGHDDRWVCLEGGSSIITTAMVEQIKAGIELQTRVTAIAIDHTKRADNLGMIVQVKKGSKDEERRYSTVFNTTTLACAQRMDLRGAQLHQGQKDAIRSLKYDASCKIAIRFKTNWWTKAGVIGGQAGTDLPIRVCVYPSYNIGDDLSQPAVLLCSYTWSQDAQRIGSLIGENGQGKSDELIDLCIKNLALLHSKVITEAEIRKQVMEYHAYDWYADPNMSGAFALFAPGQFLRLYPFLTRPCAGGNLHFVGEATSTTHAWVAGALNSAWRAVYHFLKKQQLEEGLMRPYWQAKIDALIKEFGVPDEVDIGPKGTAHLQVIYGMLKPEDRVLVSFEDQA